MRARRSRAGSGVVVRVELTPDEHPHGWWRLRGLDGRSDGAIDLPTFVIPALFEPGDLIVIRRAGDFHHGMWVPDVGRSLSLPETSRRIR